MGGIKMAQGRRYEEAFKKQIVALFNGEKSLADFNRNMVLQSLGSKHGLKG